MTLAELVARFLPELERVAHADVDDALELLGDAPRQLGHDIDAAAGGWEPCAEDLETLRRLSAQGRRAVALAVVVAAAADKMEDADGRALVHAVLGVGT